MQLTLVALTLAFVIWLYFHNNPIHHTPRFMFRRFLSWFPLGMSYAFLYMARYNLNVSKNALGSMMTKEDFGIIFGVGTFVYGLSFLINGPLVDKFGGKKGMLIATLGSSLANILMGGVTFLLLKQNLAINLTLVFSILYGINMFFQSYGAVSIIKVKAYWFHVRERGTFGAIFGTLISFGVYFAFDWGQAIVEAAKLNPTKELSSFQQIIRTVFAIDTGTTDALWLVFFIPAFLLLIWTLIDIWLIKDSPDAAGFDKFDPHDASSGEDDSTPVIISQLLKKIFTNPIMLTIAFVEFTSGVLRNGIMQWYLVFAKEHPQSGAEFFAENWGFLLMVTGVLGGFASGSVSDKLFHSRRGPPAAIMNFIMFVLVLMMIFSINRSPYMLGLSSILMIFAVIGVHSLMSGTAAADFGGRKASATASGIVDGFVYLGSGLQSISLGFLTTKDWIFWPIFLLPFTVIGFLLSLRMWKELPAATKKYIEKEKKLSGVNATQTSPGHLTHEHPRR